MDNNILATEKLYKLFIKFSIPALISMTITGLQSIVDGIFVGNFVGANAMAGINIAAPFMTTIIGGTMIIAIGGISFIGRTLGEGNVKRAQTAFKTSLIILLAAGLIISVLGFSFSSQLSGFLGANDVLIADTSNYIRYLALFVPIISMSLILGVMSKLIGKPNLFLISSIICLLTNVLLNYIFIGRLKLGTTGAAIATGLCFTVSAAILSVPFFKKETVLNFKKGEISFKDIPNILYNGSSEGISTIATATAAYVFNTTFMKFAGEIGVSAYTAVNYLSCFGNMIIFGISSGIGAIISFNYGAKNHDRVRKTLEIALIVSTVIGVALFSVLTLFGRQLTGMFISGNPQVQEIAVKGSKLFAFSFLMNGFNIVISGYFTSIGDALNSIIVAISRGLIFILIGISILPAVFDINGVWATVPFAELVTAIIIFIILYKKSCDAEDDAS